MEKSNTGKTDRYLDTRKLLRRSPMPCEIEPMRLYNEIPTDLTCQFLLMTIKKSEIENPD